MTRNSLLKLASTGVIVAIGLGAPTAVVVADSGDAFSANPSTAANRAERASRELRRGRVDRAIAAAEEAVAYAPDNAQYRYLLGQAYMSGGRFLSAEASFDAARQLGANEPRIVVGHALALIASGHQDDAVALLDANASTLPASDYGLALALAGQAERGGMVLTDVVRSGSATPRDRQNLALAYAIAGRWLEARLIAAQDLGPDRVNARIESWVAMLQTGSPLMRVAGVVGATPAEDQGMPTRLALRQAEPVAFASVDPAPIAEYAPPPPVASEELVAVALAEVEAAPAPAVAPAVLAEAEVAAAAPTPVSVDLPAGAFRGSDGIVYISQPVVQQLRAAVAFAAPQPRARRVAGAINPGRATRVAAATPAAAPATAPAPAPRAAAAEARPVSRPTGAVRTNGWVVQLGAFDSLAIARERWSQLVGRHSALGAHDGVSTAANVGGRSVYRLAATGFATRGAAEGICATVRGNGGTCFVRAMASGEQVRWASRPLPTRVASR